MQEIGGMRPKIYAKLQTPFPTEILFNLKRSAFPKIQSISKRIRGKYVDLLIKMFKNALKSVNPQYLMNIEFQRE